MSNQNTKCIFLDIDGPMVSVRAYFLNPHGSTMVAKTFDPIAVAMLNDLCEITSAKLVLCSTWRNIYTFEWIVEHFQKQGVTGEFHSDWRTPHHLTLQNSRAAEITEWLDAHPEVEQYVVIDDEWMPPVLNSTLVSTYNGLSIVNFHEALTHLGHPIETRETIRRLARCDYNHAEEVLSHYDTD